MNKIYNDGAGKVEDIKSLSDKEVVDLANNLKGGVPMATQAFDGAKEFFESLSNSAKKGLLHWLVMAKRAETRQKRIEEIASNASQNMKPKALR